MQPFTSVAIPQSAPFVHPAVGSMPEIQPVLDEVGALYPVVAYCEDPEVDEETDAEAGMDEEALDELIFAGMVSSH
jgi:hypothetical protein